jgi:malonate transporter
MQTFVHHVELAAPLFVLVLVGYVLMRGFAWPQAMSDHLSRFVFSVALPAMLFRLMSDFSQLPPVDARLLIAFFGGCLIVFVLGRLLAWKLFALDGVGQSVFALGGVFSNNVLLGLPLAKIALGDAAVPSVALVLVFNALILWTLLTVSIEWAQHGSFSLQGFAQTARGVLTNPIVAAILAGTLFGLTGVPLPALVAQPLAMVGQAAAPMALVALGMGLAEYGVRDGWRISVAIDSDQADRSAAGRLAAGAPDRPAADGNAGRRTVGVAGGRCQRLSDVAPVQHPGSAGGQQPGAVHRAGGTDDAVGVGVVRCLSGRGGGPAERSGRASALRSLRAPRHRYAASGEQRIRGNRDLRFPRFFVCQRVGCMRPVLLDVAF